jgi:ornithine carbamoyltransferase
MTIATTTHAPVDFLRVADLTPSQLEYLLDLAAKMTATPEGWRKTLRTQTVACFFEKPSTRTRVSFAAAAYRLGAQPLFLRPDELQLGRGEPIADTARVLASYAAAIVLRTFSQAEIEEVAQWADVPVINALSDMHHPCQVLADLMTVREHSGDLTGRTLVFLGDGDNNVAHSLLEAGAIAGMRIVVCGPPGYWPKPEILESARELASRYGGDIDLSNDPRSAAVGADALYTDVWVSMGEEEEQQQRRSDLSGYQVTGELMALARPGAIFLHCLPAHRGEEVAADVIDGPSSAVWQQAANRLPTEQALLYALTSGDWTKADDAAQ